MRNAGVAQRTGTSISTLSVGFYPFGTTEIVPSAFYRRAKGTLIGSGSSWNTANNFSGYVLWPEYGLPFSSELLNRPERTMFYGPPSFQVSNWINLNSPAPTIVSPTLLRASRVEAGLNLVYEVELSDPVDDFAGRFATMYGKLLNLPIPSVSGRQRIYHIKADGTVEYFGDNYVVPFPNPARNAYAACGQWAIYDIQIAGAGTLTTIPGIPESSGNLIFRRHERQLDLVKSARMVSPPWQIQDYMGTCGPGPSFGVAGLTCGRRINIISTGPVQNSQLNGVIMPPPWVHPYNLVQQPGVKNVGRFTPILTDDETRLLIET
jgi:hypothetical protein